MYEKDIPPAKVTTFLPADHPYLVFIFSYNEGAKLATQLSKFPVSNRAFDIMLGDDGSTDNSISQDLTEKFRIRGVVRLTRNMGLSANIKAGLNWYFQENRYRGVVMMNGNDKDGPEAIPHFLDKLSAGYDYVQGSRFIQGGEASNTPPLRYWAIRFIHAPLFSLAARHWMTDTTNGYRAFSSRFLSDPRVHIFQSAFQKYELEQYLAWKALRLGFKCCEMPVARRYPPPTAEANHSNFTKIKPGIGYWQMIKPILMLNLNRYR